MHRNGGHMLKDWSNVIIPEEEEINESDPKVIMDLYSYGKICEIFELNN